VANDSAPFEEHAAILGARIIGPSESLPCSARARFAMLIGFDPPTPWK
jgi:hypothetical protein